MVHPNCCNSFPVFTQTRCLPGCLAGELLQNPQGERYFGGVTRSNAKTVAMKTLSEFKPAGLRFKYLPFLVSGLSALVALAAVPTLAQDTKALTNAVTAHPAKVVATSTNQAASNGLSPGVQEILKMADAEVSMDVIKTYVETSPTAFRPTDEDIIALRKHKVTDDVVTLLMKRGAEARTAAAKAKNEAVASVMASRRAASGGFEPESYDYFRYHYLQPRAMASAYQRLYPYYQPYYGSPYAYGFGRPFSGRPYYPGPPYR